MASCPRKSALRPVYSSPPRVGVGAESGEGGQSLNPAHPFPMMLANPHPCHAGPAWVSPTYKGAGEGAAGLVWASPPPTFHASGLQVEHVLGRGREAEVLPGKAVPAPTQAVAIACGWTVGVGGRRPHSGPRQ